MNDLNPIIYQIQKVQQLRNLTNDISTISLDSSLMNQSNLSSITFPFSDFLYISSPNNIKLPLHYTPVDDYRNKKLYIKNDLIYYTFPNNIQLNDLLYSINHLIEYNPYLLEIKIPETNIEIPEKIHGFILTEKNNGYNVYYKLFVNEYHFIKNNLSERELYKIIQIFEICQPLKLYIPIIFQNNDKMNSFLNQYYNFIEYQDNNMYFIRVVYKIEQDLPEEDYKNLIIILSDIKPVQLSIHRSYLTNPKYKRYGNLFILLSEYNIENSNEDDYFYYEKRNV